MEQSDVIKFIHGLSPIEYAKFMKEVHKGYPQKSTALTNEIVNKWKNDDKKKPSTHVAPNHPPKQQPGSSGQGSKPDRVYQEVSVKVNPTSSGQESKPVREKDYPWQQSAWKTGFIFRGDKVPLKGHLFLDVEKVSMRKVNGKHLQKAATVCIVNEDGKIILWAFIRRNHADVCQYGLKITNLSERKIGIGVDISMIHKCLDICLKGNLVVGCDLANDRKALDYEHESLFDLQSVFRDDIGSFALGLMAKRLMDNRSGFQAGHHSAIDDARMTLAIFKKYKTISLNAEEMKKANKKISGGREAWKQQKPKFYSEKCSC